MRHRASYKIIRRVYSLAGAASRCPILALIIGAIMKYIIGKYKPTEDYIKIVGDLAFEFVKNNMPQVIFHRKFDDNVDLYLDSGLKASPSKIEKGGFRGCFQIIWENTPSIDEKILLSLVKKEGDKIIHYFKDGRKLEVIVNDSEKQIKHWFIKKCNYFAIMKYTRSKEFKKLYRQLYKPYYKTVYPVVIQA